MDGGLPTPQNPREAAIRAYYDQADEDYRRWSPSLHMHFGYWRWPLSPLRREPMLDELSGLVHARLGLAPTCSATALDLGCGVGAAARQLARSHPSLRVQAFTLSPEQVKHGRALTAAAALAPRVELRVGDYRALPCATASAAAAYAIESACYDPEGGAGVIREAARVLEHGGRFVIADAFRKRPLSKAARSCERGMSSGWKLPELSDHARFLALLRAHGFEIEADEDISLRLLPSVLHVPLLVLRHRIGLGRDPTQLQRDHLWASLCSLACALLFPRRFGYYLITARRTRGDQQAARAAVTV